MVGHALWQVATSNEMELVAMDKEIQKEKFEVVDLLKSCFGLECGRREQWEGQFEISCRVSIMYAFLHFCGGLSTFL